MDMASLKKFFASFTLITLVFCALILSGTNSCGESVGRSLFVGGECTAEVVSAKTVWILREDHEAVMNEKIVLVGIAVLGLMLIHRILPIKVDIAKRLWIQAQNVRRDRGLFQRDIFLPYLFATHGL